MSRMFLVTLMLFIVFNSAAGVADEQMALLAPSITTTLPQALSDVTHPLIKKAGELEISSPMINVISTPETLSAQANQTMDVVFYCNGHNCLYTSQGLIRR